MCREPSRDARATRSRAGTWLLATIVAGSPSLSHAAEQSAGSRQRVDLEARGAAVMTLPPRGGGFETAVAGYWKPTARVALGGVAAWMLIAYSTLESSVVGGFQPSSYTFWRLGPSVRWDFHEGPSTRAWLGGDLGAILKVASGQYAPAIGSDARRRDGTEVTPLPYVGLTAGVAVYVVEKVSLGVQIGAQQPIAPADTFQSSATAGLVVGVHLGRVVEKRPNHWLPQR